MRLVVWLMALTLIAIVVVIGAMLASEMIVKPMVAERVEADWVPGGTTSLPKSLPHCQSRSTLRSNISSQKGS